MLRCSCAISQRKSKKKNKRISSSEHTCFVFIWTLHLAVRGFTCATPSFMKSGVLSENWAIVRGTSTQRCTNPGRQVARATELCIMVPNIFGFLVWNLLRMTFLALKVLRWVLVFFFFFGIIVYPWHIYVGNVKWTDTCLRVPCDLKYCVCYWMRSIPLACTLHLKRCRPLAYNMWDVVSV
jgi:hypothetical protein